MKTVIRPLLALAAIAVASALFVACGDDDGDAGSPTAASGTDLTAVKTYLVDHASELAAQAETIKGLAGEYYRMAEAADFDYEKLLAESCAQVDETVSGLKEAFVAANPAYEEMEGIVAGVPRLAHYDTDIDAGSDASDPESAVSFNLTLPDGSELKQPGNLFFLVETSLYGTNPELTATGVKPDVDCDGKVEFGEGLPEAGVFRAAADELSAQADSLLADAEAFEPTESDAFTAIVVMTPTMSEYFGQWKNTARVAGAGKQTEPGFVAASRLEDIASILTGINFTYEEIEPLIATENAAQAEQTATELGHLLDFAIDLRDREAAGENFTAKQADQLGAEAQAQAEKIAGQVTQAAQQLGIELQES